MENYRNPVGTLNKQATKSEQQFLTANKMYFLTCSGLVVRCLDQLNIEHISNFSGISSNNGWQISGSVKTNQ